MRDSRPGRLQPEPVATFTTDVSPYGVSDLGGGMREWCGDTSFSGDQARRAVRGGSWFSDGSICKAALRYGSLPWHAVSHNGFRLSRAPVTAEARRKHEASGP